MSFRDTPVKIDPVYFYGRKDFSTGFDHLFAQFKANDLLRDFLDNELAVLKLMGDAVKPDPLNFTGSAADFVQFVELVKSVGKPVDARTGQPISEEQLFKVLKKAFNAQLPEGMNFDTLRLISGDSDLAERMADSLDKLHEQWREEERDIDYPPNDEDKDQGDDNASDELLPKN